jgi:hypothetical protein
MGQLPKFNAENEDLTYTALRVYFIACKTSPISRNNARYDNAIKASLMMALEPRAPRRAVRTQWRRLAVATAAR